MIVIALIFTLESQLWFFPGSLLILLPKTLILKYASIFEREKGDKNGLEIKLIQTTI